MTIKVVDFVPLGVRGWGDFCIVGIDSQQGAKSWLPWRQSTCSTTAVELEYGQLSSGRFVHIKTTNLASGEPEILEGTEVVRLLNSSVSLFGTPSQKFLYGEDLERPSRILQSWSATNIDFDGEQIQFLKTSNVELEVAIGQVSPTLLVSVTCQGVAPEELKMTEVELVAPPKRRSTSGLSQ